MAPRVLVTYASKHASTQGVAERVALSLDQLGVSVDIRPMNQVDAIDGYDAVVIAARTE